MPAQEILASFGLSSADWLVTGFSALLIGAAKTGLSGVSMVSVPLLAGVFGARASAGIILPVLSAGDVLGVSYYHSHADWGHLAKLLPWTFAGILAGVVTGNRLSEDGFRAMFSVVILVGVVLMTWQELRGKREVPQSRWFSVVAGLAGGFATMIGNAAGPVMALYLLSMRFPKNVYIGTAAWFFVIVNLTKTPFHWFVWGTVTPRTLVLDASMLPAVGIGAVVGIVVTKRIPERAYRIFIIVITALAALKLVI